MVQLNSPAKLNLYLEVLKKRADGYHNIRTIFERVSLNDKITIKKNKSGCIRIRTTSKDIPKDSANIVYKAASLLRSDFDIREGVDIQIKKRIPVGAGLGGGSSNAASALLGLNLLWNLKLSTAKLLRYGDKLGSDVAFFLYRRPFAIGTSRGNKINILNKLKKNFWHIVIVANVKVSTRDIYEEFDRLSNEQELNKLPPKQLLELDGDSIENILFNRLEEVTFKKYPVVKKVKEILEAQGVRKTLMSGSGGAVFGIVKSRKEGLRIARSFKDSRCIGKYKNTFLSPPALLRTSQRAVVWLPNSQSQSKTAGTAKIAPAWQPSASPRGEQTGMTGDKSNRRRRFSWNLKVFVVRTAQ